MSAHQKNAGNTVSLPHNIIKGPVLFKLAFPVPALVFLQNQGSLEPPHFWLTADICVRKLHSKKKKKYSSITVIRYTLVFVSTT